MLERPYLCFPPPPETPVRPPSWSIVPNKFSLSLSLSLPPSRSFSLSLALALSLSRARTLSLSFLVGRQLDCASHGFAFAPPGQPPCPRPSTRVAYNLELYPYSKALN